MRQPGIHVTKEVLRELLAQGIKLDKNVDSLVSFVFRNAKQYTITHRSLLEGNRKTAKKANKITLSTLSDAQEFSSILTLIRRSLHHKGINIIKEDGKEWAQIKEVTKLARDFMEDFDISDRKKGFTTYIKLVIKAMSGKFILNRVNSMHPFICELYKAQQRIESDNHYPQTRKAYEYYTVVIAKKTGIVADLTTQWTKYQYFIDIIDEAKSMGISYEVYIDAQFAAFDWKSAVPEVAQMVGDKARERVAKYMYQEGIEANKPVNNIVFKRIRK